MVSVCIPHLDEGGGAGRVQGVDRGSCSKEELHDGRVPLMSSGRDGGDTFATQLVGIRSS